VSLQNQPPLCVSEGSDMEVGDWFGRNMKRLRGGLVFKANRLEYPSNLGLSVIKKRREEG